MKRTLIKICGIRDSSAALEAVRAGADFLGIVARPSLLRSVAAEEAAEIVAAVRGSAARTVGVFVDPALGDIEAFVATSGVDLIQLHGREAPDFCLQVARAVGRPVIKALRIRGSAPEIPVEPYRGLPLHGLLFDAYSADSPGGSGRSFDWACVRAVDAGSRRVFLAGGLTPDNVGAAIQAARPFAVDVSSGVESEPGKKSPSLIRAFCEEVRRGSR